MLECVIFHVLCQFFAYEYCFAAHLTERAEHRFQLGELEGFYVALSLYIPVSRGRGVKGTRPHGLLLSSHDLLQDYSESRQPDAWDSFILDMCPHLTTKYFSSAVLCRRAHTPTLPTLPDAEKPDEDPEGEELFEPATPT